MHSFLYFHPYKAWKKLLKKVDSSHFLQIIVPLVMALGLFLVSWGITHVVIFYINTMLPEGKRIIPKVYLGSILLGITIYIKTAVDFAILMANYMQKFPGWRNRIAIELGTTTGNTLGTIVIIIIWGLLHQFAPILGFMVFYSGLVLFRLAYETLEGTGQLQLDFSTKYPLVEFFVDMILLPVNLLIRITVFLIRLTWRAIEIIGLDRFIPRLHISTSEGYVSSALTFWGLFALNFMVPFALGLDDFAGYMALLSVTNVLSFAIGVYLGHFVLNFFLFLYPEHTVKLMKNPFISWLGAAVLYFIAVLSVQESVDIAYELLLANHMLQRIGYNVYSYVSGLSLQFVIVASALIISVSNILGCKKHETK